MPNHDNLKRLFAECAAEHKLREAAGDPDACLTWVLAESFIAVLDAGYQISDLDCFQEHPLYTGNKLKAEISAPAESMAHELLNRN